MINVSKQLVRTRNDIELQPVLPMIYVCSYIHSYNELWQLHMQLLSSLAAFCTL